MAAKKSLVEFFKDENIVTLEQSINKFLEKDIHVISMQQSQSSYVLEDQDMPGSFNSFTEIVVCIFYNYL